MSQIGTSTASVTKFVRQHEALQVPHAEARSIKKGGSTLGSTGPRPHETYSQRWTVSNFFQRDPLRATAVLPQLGQPRGCVAV